MDSSLIMVTQLKIAPETIPAVIMGTVTLKNDFIFEAPREMAASSILIGICCRIATEERIVYGSRRITRATTMISMVPLNITGFLLKPVRSAIPRTVPGTI